MTKSFIFAALFSTQTLLHAQPAPTPAPTPSPTPTPNVVATDKQVYSCSPFEIWTRTVATLSPGGVRTTEVKRVWAKLEKGKREFDMRETSNFKLINQSETISCDVSAWHSKPVNPEGDFLSVVSTCGQFVPLIMMPTFMNERIFYVFSKNGQTLKKGLCTKFKKKPGSTEEAELL